MYYVIDHFYAINHMDYCRVVQSDKNVFEVAEILIAIQFYFEENVDESHNPEMDNVIKLLEKYYEFKIVDKESVKNRLSSVMNSMSKSDYDVDPGEYPEFEFKDDSYMYIDMYETREGMCKPEQPDKLYSKWLTSKIKEEIKKLPCE